MTTACIIQARIGSARLPAKVLLPLPTGRTVLEEVIFRCRQIKGIDVVVAAIPDTSDNDILVASAEKAAEPYCNHFAEIAERVNKSFAPVQTIRGPEHNVLARYALAAHIVDADVIMRVTADCPMIDPKTCGEVLSLFMDHGHLDYCSNVHPRTFPQGLDCEVFSRAALLDAARANTTDYQREHVTPYIAEHPDCRKTGIVSPVDRSHHRWTLDTIEDYVRIWGLLANRHVQILPLESAGCA